MSSKERFDNWNKLKQEIHLWESDNFFVKEWQVWFINQWENIWTESNWKWKFFKRAVLVLKKVWNLFFVVSMTTKWKENNKFYYNLDKSYFNKKSAVILSQVKVIDKNRFFEEIWIISENDFEKIKKELKNLLF